MNCRVSNFDQELLLNGCVKWYDPVRGFGFLTDHQTGEDVLLQREVLLAFGQSSVATGIDIEVIALRSERGLRAVEIFEIDHNTHETNPSEVTLVPARVRWYDKQKGFGFVNLCGDDEDYLLNADTLCRGGLASVDSGEAIGVYVQEGVENTIVVQAAPWSEIDFSVGNNHI